MNRDAIETRDIFTNFENILVVENFEQKNYVVCTVCGIRKQRGIEHTLEDCLKNLVERIKTLEEKTHYCGPDYDDPHVSGRG